MKQHQGSLSSNQDTLLRPTGLSKNPGVLWLAGEDRNKLAVIAITLEHVLKRQGNLVSLLDQDQISTGLCSDLGDSREEREEYIRRVAETAKILDETGLLTIVLVDVYNQDEWAKAREHLSFTRFSVAYVNSTELWEDECADKQRADSEKPLSTSVPEHSELQIPSDDLRVEDVINQILGHLDKRGSLHAGYTAIGGYSEPVISDKDAGDIPIAVAAG